MKGDELQLGLAKGKFENGEDGTTSAAREVS